MTALPTTHGHHAPDDAWPGDVVTDFEWPVVWGYEVTFDDGSVGYYPSWEAIPNKILKLQGEDGDLYSDVDVVAVSWGDA